jgi:RimJ/RimL family protein N-acetyltransferase
VLPEFRPMRPGGLAAFCDRAENSAALLKQLGGFLDAGSVLPEWCWTAAAAGGAVLARHYWWGLPGSGKPVVVTSVSAGDPTAAVGLLVHVRDRLGVEEARCEVVAPRGLGDNPSAVRSDLVAVLGGAGFGLEVSRVRVEWTPSAGIAPVAGRLTMLPARRVGEEALVGLFRAVGEGSLDHGMTAGRARLGEVAEARERLDFVRSFPAEPEWFTVGLTPGGEPVGYVAPGLAGGMPVVAEIGVAAAHRGHGYVNDLLAHATRVLAATGAERIRADTDRANGPMRAAFDRAGYQEFAWRDDYTWRREGALLTTSRLRLTPLTMADADEMSQVLADGRMHEFIGGSPASAEELRARYGRLVSGRSPDGSQVWHNWIVRTLDGAAVGTVQATVVDDGSRAEVAWAIGRPYWGHGYASEAALAVIHWLARAGVGEVLAHIHPGHRASQTVARRAGLRRTEVFQDGEQRWIRRFAPAPP